MGGGLFQGLSHLQGHPVSESGERYSVGGKWQAEEWSCRFSGPVQEQLTDGFLCPFRHNHFTLDFIDRAGLSEF